MCLLIGQPRLATKYLHCAIVMQFVVDSRNARLP